MNVKMFGPVEEKVISQMTNCMELASFGVLSADNHLGYAQPVGATVAYKNHISLSGVGFDIACGNKAVKTNLRYDDIKNEMARIMDEVRSNISFGVGRKNKAQVDHPVLEKIAQANLSEQRDMVKLASEQLGTVGSGNHYVDIFKDEEGFVWIGVHFGSRGFGYKTTSGFIALSKGAEFADRVSEGGMMEHPILFEVGTPLADSYIEAMSLAGEYAYAGRDIVCNEVLKILQAQSVEEIHNHHNFAWKEKHFGEEFWVVRKGCTPAFPGQKGFVGASMGGNSVVLEGVDSSDSKEALYTTVHGAGRVMSRTQAAGKFKGWGRRRRQVMRGVVNFNRVKEEIKAAGIELRGAGADEAPEVYKPLDKVLEYHKGTVKILHTLVPVGVVMAGSEDWDPYKD